MTPEEHHAAVEAWHAGRARRLRSPDGWLALVGLSWLQPGVNRVGSDPGCEVVLPRGPAHAATITLAEHVLLRAEPGSGLRHEGESVDEIELVDDRDDEPTIVELGSIHLHVISRGERLAVRVRDAAAPALAAFHGIDRFGVDLRWRVTARLEEGGGRTIRVPDVLGTLNDEECAGTLRFELEGRVCRLDALPGGDDGRLWLLFADATNGEETYPSGRFVYSEPPRDGSVVVDFNLAYNPPCAFTPYATCPLPPEQNRLPIAIRAGERSYHPPPD